MYYMQQECLTQIKEILYCDPLSIFNGLHHQKWAILLDSAQFNAHYGRYSYIAVEPFNTLWSKNELIEVTEDVNGLNATSCTNPFYLLKNLLSQFIQPKIPNLPPFQGGVAGTFSYDLLQHIEGIESAQRDDLHFPDLALGVYDVVISFDHVEKKAWIISTGWPELTLETRLERAISRLNYFDELIKTINPSIKKTTVSACEPLISSNFNAATYSEAVQKVIEYILRGDIFEANISQCFKGELKKDGSAYELYKKLRLINPAPFSAFANLGEFYVVSASPERFIKLDNRMVETRPIKGTRPRGETPERDKQLADELTLSSKDRAENVMIVDLLRNDLSKVSKNNSVIVSQLCGLESYATVHHLVSVVESELTDDKDAVDLLLATFPGGSITGAPKVRAMEIIAEIEPTKRGIYCGSLGFISFNGDMDTSIAIRTYTVKQTIVTFQAGGAVVADSQPQEEYQETLTKSVALQRAATEA